MAMASNVLVKIRRVFSLDKYGIPILVALMLSLIVAVVYYSQKLSEQTSLPPIVTASSKEQYEIAKLAAEIRQIRSDTSGSLFWLKMIALFVTVGGAVGGYLLGQKHTTKKRLEFEKLKNIDSIYQGIILELADQQNPLRRAAAAVRLGMLLNSFPTEWDVDEKRVLQMINLTKKVLAASLAIEEDPKVLKTLTIALALHTFTRADPTNPKIMKTFGDLRELDLSSALSGSLSRNLFGSKSVEAYWAKVDFSKSDFYRANLTAASFRESILSGTQFREAILRGTVFADAWCKKTNFNMADLRNARFRKARILRANFQGADLRDATFENACLVSANFQGADIRNVNFKKAKLLKANFDGAKVFGCDLSGAQFEKIPDALVDNSRTGDVPHILSAAEWLSLDQEPISH